MQGISIAPGQNAEKLKVILGNSATPTHRENGSPWRIRAGAGAK
jgi:hypothetical protein